MNPKFLVLLSRKKIHEFSGLSRVDHNIPILPLEFFWACFETGKFLSDPKVKYKEVNGHNASHYLEKVNTMFKEMDLQRDLQEYSKYIQKL
jgi:hypothetical protein